jgi:2-oxoglutarate dehydrogenase E2 component (dihydrolipoamide succinyltransferase)
MFSDFVIKVPNLGDSISEGQIVELSKAVGDSVDVDEVVAVLETDKVSVDVTSPKKGQVKSITTEVGQTVKIDAPLMTILLGDSASQTASTTPKAEISSSASSASHQSTESSTSASGGPVKGTPAYEPLIKFRYGKANKNRATLEKATAPPVIESVQTSSSKKESPAQVFTFEDLPLRYRPQVLRNSEIDAINVIESVSCFSFV